MVMIFALGAVSGAHFNPAVTLAVALSGRGLIHIVDVFVYMIVQIAGGICAAITYSAITGKAFFSLSCVGLLRCRYSGRGDLVQL